MSSTGFIEPKGVKGIYDRRSYLNSEWKIIEQNTATHFHWCSDVNWFCKNNFLRWYKYHNLRARFVCVINYIIPGTDSYFINSGKQKNINRI